MRTARLFLQFLNVTCMLLVAAHLHAGQVHLAVASNFTQTAKILAGNFEKQTGHKVLLSVASTGKLYAQILHGAPFDIFLAGDRQRPSLLEQQGKAKTGSRFTYATGRLVLWSPRDGLVDSQGNILQQQNFIHLAIANPELAPYGKAAQQVLNSKGIWENLQNKLVRGENISQTLQFVQSGNAELGFISLSQLQTSGLILTGSLWEIPQNLYLPIEQQAVLLTDNPVAVDFLQFLKSHPAREIIQHHGYITG